MTPVSFIHSLLKQRPLVFEGFPRTAAELVRLHATLSTIGDRLTISEIDASALGVRLAEAGVLIRGGDAINEEELRQKLFQAAGQLAAISRNHPHVVSPLGSRLALFASRDEKAQRGGERAKIDKASLFAITSASDYDPGGLMDLLYEDPEIALMYGHAHEVPEGGDLLDHTLNVMHEFETQVFTRGNLGAEFNRFLPVMRLALALHDIGKGRPGGRADQHKNTADVIRRKFVEWSFSIDEADLFIHLLCGNHLGGVLHTNLHYNPSNAVAKITELARDAGIPLNAYMTALTLYYIADSSAYPLVRASLHRGMGDGRLMIKRDWKRLAEVLDGIARESGSAFHPDLFMTTSPVEPEGFLSKRVQELRWKARVTKIVLPRFDGVEFPSSDAAIADLKTRYDKRVGVDLDEVDAARWEVIKKLIDRELDSSVEKGMLLVLKSSRAERLNGLTALAQIRGVATCAIVPVSIFDPKNGGGIRRQDYWIIQNSYSPDTKGDLKKVVTALIFCK